jgi:mannose-6-phosphate isomerase-like protein (cupin superfamily)
MRKQILAATLHRSPLNVAICPTIPKCTNPTMAAAERDGEREMIGEGRRRFEVINEPGRGGPIWGWLMVAAGGASLGDLIDHGLGGGLLWHHRTFSLAQPIEASPLSLWGDSFAAPRRLGYPMNTFSTTTLPLTHDVFAPDGSEVRVLLSLSNGSMAHFLLPAGQVSRAVRHRTVEEIWYIIFGQGEMWRSDHEHEEISTLTAGTCLTIPAGTSFQFRALGDEPVAAVAVTVPPWPGNDEAEIVDGRWQPTVRMDY